MLSKQDKKFIIDTFDQKFDEKFDQKFDQKFNEKMSELKSELFNYMDPFLKEIRAMREEATLQFHRLSNHTNQLGNHEERISSLEKRNLSV